MDKEIFDTLAKKFNVNGFRLYMIGGTSRDYLLNLDVFDYDFVTDATPDDIRKIGLDADYTFAKYGTVKVKILDTKVDLTTLRTESDYDDYRHPRVINFVKSIEKDYVRRDFTINAIYIDEKYSIIDPANGLKDLKNHIIRFIGDPETRVKEDPLRIHRAKRFAEKLNFSFEEETKKCIDKFSYLLDRINPDKIKLEKSKTK